MTEADTHAVVDARRSFQELLGRFSAGEPGFRKGSRVPLRAPLKGSSGFGRV